MFHVSFTFDFDVECRRNQGWFSNSPYKECSDCGSSFCSVEVDTVGFCGNFASIEVDRTFNHGGSTLISFPLVEQEGTEVTLDLKDRE